MSLRIFQPSSLGRGARIAATGSYLPAHVVTNAELARRGAPLTDDEIVRLSGIRSRHYAADDEATSDLAVQASRRALERLAKPRVDRLYLATVSPDHPSPSAACIAQRALELGDAPAMDLTASCSGFLYALDCAARAAVCGETVLAVAADVRSRFIDPLDRATCALFGDGAGAAVVKPCKPGEGIEAIGLFADGTGARSVYVPAGGSREPATAQTVATRRHTIRMEEGPQVYLAAVEGMLAAAEELLKATGRTFDDVALVVPHQPNRRILDRLAKLARLPEEKLFVNVDRIGNVSGATVAIAFDEALRAGRLKEDEEVLLLAAGAGYTAGAALVRIDAELLAASRFDPAATSSSAGT
ncbi:MAG: 3-oxoacyl-ACP synthase III family protein [Myxococcales bacterium]|nr:beta-ketoacyl-ACP synthase 3 [Myxococcales bacterium]